MYDNNGEVLTRGGKAVPRPKGMKTPCGTCPKVPPGLDNATSEDALELDPQLREAWEFYKQCRAVGQWPADPLVRWCAAQFRAAEDHCDRVGTGRMQLTLINAVKGV